MLVLVTPDAAVEGHQGAVEVKMLYVQVPEAFLAGPGWEQFHAAGNDSWTDGVFAPGQAKEFIEALQKMEGVDILGETGMITMSGHAAIISTGEDNDFTLTTALLPAVSDDGRTVDLTVTNSP